MDIKEESSTSSSDFSADEESRVQSSISQRPTISVNRDTPSPPDSSGDDDADASSDAGNIGTDDEKSDHDLFGRDELGPSSASVWEPARNLKKSYPNWDSKHVEYKSRFSRVRRGRRRRIQLGKEEDFLSMDRADMYVSDLTNYMGIWMSKGDLKANCERLNTVQLSENEKVVYFQVDDVAGEVGNQAIFEAWYKSFLTRRRLPNKLEVGQDQPIMEVEYSMPMGDEWAFHENPVHSRWVGGSQFLGRVHVFSKDEPR